MITRISLAVMLLLVVSGCGSPTPSTPDTPMSHAGGDPMPERATEIDFLWIGKQSVMCVGDAFERQVAFVDFSAEGGALEVGQATLDAKGQGQARFAIPVATLRTGHEDRDVKLQGGLWLDAENHPELVFESTKLERVLPTVWQVEGNWTMKGVSKPVRFYANARYVPEMDHVGKDVVRMSAAFDIELADFGVGGKYVGTPAVASTWTVELVLLGTMK